MLFPEIATITYRSGPEWDQRFGRKFRELPPSEWTETQPSDGLRIPRPPALCPDFLIETYLDHQVWMCVPCLHAPPTMAPSFRESNFA
jgi:homoserine acetyltransferase